jgi:6-phosphogluconolactonase/glucosamine-6-phosphate isomerase/deaminase
MFQKLFLPLNMPSSHIHYLNAKSIELNIECIKIDKLIDLNEGFDFMLLGIGSNGHLAMNESGTSFDIRCLFHNYPNQQ